MTITDAKTTDAELPKAFAMCACLEFSAKLTQLFGCLFDRNIIEGSTLRYLHMHHGICSNKYLFKLIFVQIDICSNEYLLPAFAVKRDVPQFNRLANFDRYLYFWQTFQALG